MMDFEWESYSLNRWSKDSHKCMYQVCCLRTILFSGSWVKRLGDGVGHEMVGKRVQ